MEWEAMCSDQRGYSVESDDVMVRSDFLQYPAYLTDPNGLVHREQQR